MVLDMRFGVGVLVVCLKVFCLLFIECVFLVLLEVMCLVFGCFLCLLLSLFDVLFVVECVFVREKWVFVEKV